MLTLEDKKNCMRYNIKWDHCYTSKHQNVLSTQNKPSHVTPTTDKSITPTCNNLRQCKIPDKVKSDFNNRNSNILAKLDKVEKISRLLKNPVCRNSGRPQRSIVLKNPAKYYSESEKIDRLVDNGIIEDESFSSSESSQSSTSDSSSSDSDTFEKPAVIQRKKTKSQIIKDASKNISRRQDSKKEVTDEHLSLKTIIQNKLKYNKSLYDDKKLIKVSNQENKDASVLTATEGNSSSPLHPTEINVLQTKNPVKANLIKSNMFEGNMILTKPGENKKNKNAVTEEKSSLPLCPTKINILQTKNHVKASLIKSNMFEGGMILTKPGENKKNQNAEKKKLDENFKGSKIFKLNQEEISKDQSIKLMHPKVHSTKDGLSNFKSSKNLINTSQKSLEEKNKSLEKPVSLDKKKLPDVKENKSVKKEKIKSTVLDSSVKLKPVGK